MLYFIGPRRRLENVGITPSRSNRVNPNFSTSPQAASSPSVGAFSTSTPRRRLQRRFAPPSSRLHGWKTPPNHDPPAPPAKFPARPPLKRARKLPRNGETPAPGHHQASSCYSRSSAAHSREILQTYYNSDVISLRFRGCNCIPVIRLYRTLLGLS